MLGPETPSPRRSLSFRLKVTLLAVIAAVAPVIVVGWLVSTVNRTALDEVNRQLLDAAVVNVASNVRATLDDADATLSKIGSVLDEPAATRDPVVEVAIDLAKHVQGVAVYDDGGAQLTSLDGPRGRSIALPATLPAELRRDGFRSGEVRFVAGRAYMLRTFTLTRKRTLTVAAYVALSPIADYAISLVSSRTFGGHILVVTNDRVAIADSLNERVGLMVEAGDVHMLAMFDRGALSHDLYSSSIDQGVFGALRTVDNTPFTIVVEMPYDDVFRSVGAVKKLVLLAVVVAMLASIVLGIVLAHRVTRPISELVDYAGELSKRRFDTRMTVRGHDELGVLGSALERAAANLKASDEQISREVAIRNDLRRYLPSNLVEDVIARKRSLALGGDRRDVTIVFADVVGFTSLAERQPAEHVVNLLNELFTILTEIVFRHGGTVDKFVGDCVMAVWGATDDQPDHALRAVRAARDMLRWLEVGNELWLERFGFKIELAIGINSGEAVVGNLGSESRMEYTAIGDVVNVAARLESIARPDQILTTAATRDRAFGSGDDGFVSLGIRPIIGKGQPIEVFEVRP